MVHDDSRSSELLRVGSAQSEANPEWVLLGRKPLLVCFASHGINAEPIPNGLALMKSLVQLLGNQVQLWFPFVSAGAIAKARIGT
jgi:hypothetical protein